MYLPPAEPIFIHKKSTKLVSYPQIYRGYPPYFVDNLRFYTYLGLLLFFERIIQSMPGQHRAFHPGRHMSDIFECQSFVQLFELILVHQFAFDHGDEFIGKTAGVFDALAANKLKSGGILHLATDWESYAEEMLEVIGQSQDFQNLASDGRFIEPRPDRPVTKFEQRGIRLGHVIHDLMYRRA